MDYRTPLQRLLHRLLPSRAPAEHRDPTSEFADTRPDTDWTPLAARDASPALRPIPARSLGAVDPVPGTEVVEFQDTLSADLMDEFFAESHKRAA